MPRVTSKLQLTVPKKIADQYGIRPGDEIQWVPAGEIIRVVPAHGRNKERELTVKERLALFDRATERQRRREKTQPLEDSTSKNRGRGWKREDLYQRDLSD